MARQSVTKKKLPKRSAKKKTGDSSSSRLLSRVEMAEAMRVKVDVFDKSYRKKIPEDLVVMRGNRPFWKLEAMRSLYDLAAREAEAKARAKFNSDFDADMLSGADSPALERYRLARAKSEEMDLAKKEGTLLPAEDAGKLIDIYSHHVRGAGEKLGKDYGDLARNVLDDALDEAAKEFEQQFGSADETI